MPSLAEILDGNFDRNITLQKFGTRLDTVLIKRTFNALRSKIELDSEFYLGLTRRRLTTILGFVNKTSDAIISAPREAQVIPILFLDRLSNSIELFCEAADSYMETLNDLAQIQAFREKISSIKFGLSFVLHEVNHRTSPSVN